MAIVTISQQVGTGGAEIGLALAERLGYCFVDHERFLERTQRYGLDAHRLWHLEKEPPSLFERFARWPIDCSPRGSRSPSPAMR
jgi:hypothetical protein